MLTLRNRGSDSHMIVFCCILTTMLLVNYRIHGDRWAEDEVGGVKRENTTRR